MGSTVDVSDLGVRVEERLTKIRRVIAFVESVVSKRGKIVEKRILNWNTPITTELRDFGGFSFSFSTAETMYGGATIYIWYHPGEEMIDIWKTDKVFQVQWWKNDKPYVRTFSEDPAWQEAIEPMLVGFEEFLAQRASRKAGEEAEADHQAEVAQEERDAAAKAAGLPEEAKRLGLV